MIKRIAPTILLLISSLSFSQTDDFFDKADAFLSKHVKNGLVDYEAIYRSQVELNELMMSIEEAPIKEDSKKAYLINVYNLAVIYKVIQLYPILSPQDDGTFFTRKDLTVGGEKTSLDILENEVLRPYYKDARLHFVLVCGAKGCPQIEPFAYRPEKLEEQLDVQTKKAVENPAFLWTDEKSQIANLSEIFKWYSEDFGKTDVEIIQYINKYRSAQIVETTKLQYYTYDWTLNAVNLPHIEGSDEINLQTFTAGSLLGKGQMDFTLFNSLYTQTRSNWQGVTSTGFRQTFVTNLIQFTIGVSKNKRLNVGLDLNLKYNGNSVDDSFGTVGRAFQFKNNDSTRFGLTSLGPRIKWQPFKNVSNFSIQSTVYIPTVRHPEGFSDPAGQNNLSWADWDRYQWWNQFFFDKTWKKFQLFAEVDLWFRFQRNASQRSMVDIPWNLFFSWFPTKKMTLYVMSQHMNRLPINFQPNNDWVTFADYTASGAGMKYNIARGLNLELLYSYFWRAKNAGFGHSFNLGIKYIP